MASSPSASISNPRQHLASLLYRPTIRTSLTRSGNTRMPICFVCWKLGVERKCMHALERSNLSLNMYKMRWSWTHECIEDCGSLFTVVRLIAEVSAIAVVESSASGGWVSSLEDDYHLSRGFDQCKEGVLCGGSACQGADIASD